MVLFPIIYVLSGSKSLILLPSIDLILILYFNFYSNILAIANDNMDI